MEHLTRLVHGKDDERARRSPCRIDAGQPVWRLEGQLRDGALVVKNRPAVQGIVYVAKMKEKSFRVAILEGMTVQTRLLPERFVAHEQVFAKTRKLATVERDHVAIFVARLDESIVRPFVDRIVRNRHAGRVSLNPLSIATKIERKDQRAADVCVHESTPCSLGQLYLLPSPDDRTPFRAGNDDEMRSGRIVVKDLKIERRNIARNDDAVVIGIAR